MGSTATPFSPSRCLPSFGWDEPLTWAPLGGSIAPVTAALNTSLRLELVLETTQRPLRSPAEARKDCARRREKRPPSTACFKCVKPACYP
jgi:hypothetical protein